MLEVKNGADGQTAREKCCITILDKGPYMVYGHPPLSAQFIMPDAQGGSWYFQEGCLFSTETKPTALCRCGASHNKPYCDGTHTKIEWAPEITARPDRILDNVDTIDGETLILTDNEKYCVFARFCDPHGGVWNLTGQSSDNPAARRIAVREASLCPSARLIAWDSRSGKPYEFRFEPSLGLIEDPVLGMSGGLWVRGGIPIRREDDTLYEIRNRVVLCRCGNSANKPYCDGAHAPAKWRDGVEGIPTGKTLPEKV